MASPPLRGAPRRLPALVLGTLAVVGLLVSALGPAAADEPTPREQQWGLERIRAPEAWEVARGGDRVVAVVDTGVDLGHPDLAPRLLRDREGRVVGRDFVDDDARPQDRHGHGTQVAGVAAAAEDAGLVADGIAGAAPGARIMPVRSLDEDGAGSVADVDAGIRWAVDHGADVVNLSLESMTPVGGQLLGGTLDEAIHYAWERGVVVVAAAGNDGTPFTDYDDATPVLLVGATDRDDRRALFSSTGRDDMVLAPGVDIISSWCDPCGEDPERHYASSSGTSLAAPFVAGTVALLRADGADHRRAVERVRATAVPVPDEAGISSGHGRIDAAAAVGVDDQPDADEDSGGDEGTPPESSGTEEPSESEPAGSDDPSSGDAGGDEAGAAAGDPEDGDQRSPSRDERAAEAGGASEQPPPSEETGQQTPNDAGTAGEAEMVLREDVDAEPPASATTPDAGPGTGGPLAAVAAALVVVSATVLAVSARRPADRRAPRGATGR